LIPASFVYTSDSEPEVHKPLRVYVKPHQGAWEVIFYRIRMLAATENIPYAINDSNYKIENNLNSDVCNYVVDGACRESVGKLQHQLLH
jgi:hypothetical protein